MRKYSAEFRAQVIAEWKTGEAAIHLARIHGINGQTVNNWVKNEHRLPVKPEHEVYKEQLEALQDDIDAIAWRHVKAGAAASEAILAKAQDPSWLDKQDAPGLAILYGVIADKQLRLLAAYEREDAREVRGSDEPGTVDGEAIAVGPADSR
jgi:transposase-like protein